MGLPRGGRRLHYLLVKGLRRRRHSRRVFSCRWDLWDAPTVGLLFGKRVSV